MPKIGAHVSGAGSVDLSLERARDIGATCTQIFLTPPQMWLKKEYPEEISTKYLEKAKELGIGPNFIHGVYLINLATDNLENLKKAVEWLIYSQKTAGKMGITGTIFHLGSHKGRGFENVEKQVCEALEEILISSPTNTQLILENSAGAGRCIGANFPELGKLLKSVADPRLKVCFDTQHAYVMGYDITTKSGQNKVFAEFESEIGLKNLVVIHANDSKTDFKSNRDRHENIGQGFIGKEAFEALINKKEFADLPFILEVPGFADTGPDKENIDILKSFLKG